MNKKLAAALMVPMIAAGIGMSKAEDECCSATAILTATLQEECTLIFEGGNVGAMIDPATGALDTAFTPKFKLATNGGEHKLVLGATVQDSLGVHKNALAKVSGTEYIALGNTGTKPTSTAISNALGSTPAAASNRNVVVYPVSSVAMSGASSGNLVFSTISDKFETTAMDPAQTGTSFITMTSGSTARANTFSSATDTAGVYKAELTLTAYQI